MNGITAVLPHMDLSLNITHYKPLMTLYLYATHGLWMNCIPAGWCSWIGLFSSYVRLGHLIKKERIHLHHTVCSFRTPPLQCFAPVSLAISCAFLYNNAKQHSKILMKKNLSLGNSGIVRCFKELDKYVTCLSFTLVSESQYAKTSKVVKWLYINTYKQSCKVMKVFQKLFLRIWP